MAKMFNSKMATNESKRNVHVGTTMIQLDASHVLIILFSQLR